MGSARRMHSIVGLLAVCLAVPVAHAGVHVYMEGGNRMQAESWAAKSGAVVADDAMAQGGKAVRLPLDGGAMEKSFDLRRSYYCLSVWVRSEAEVCIPPAYLELTVGETTYRVRTRYNYEGGYVPGYATTKWIGQYPKDSDGLWNGENTRFYFPVDVAGNYTLKLKMGERSKVSLMVDQVELRDVLLHITPGATKKKRVLVSDEELRGWERLRGEMPEAQAFCEKTLAQVRDKIGRTDEAMWNSIPSPYVPRSYGGPDPVHGWENVRKGGIANPWRGGGKWWQVTSLIDGKLYPTNDYEHGDMTSGEYPDDGWGCKYKSDSKEYEDHYGMFVARGAAKQWQRTYGDIDTLAKAYIVTGDRQIAHKTAVLLAAIARNYPGYDYRYQSSETFSGYRGRGTLAGAVVRDFPCAPGQFAVAANNWGYGKVFYSGWTAGHDAILATAYDLLFPAILEDDELLRFVGSKVDWVKTRGDLQELFDRYLLGANSELTNRYVNRSDENGWEHAAAVLGAVQDGPEAQKVLQTLVTRACLDSSFAGGFDDGLINMLGREGMSMKVSPMYNFNWAKGFEAAVDILGRIPDPELRRRYALNNPRIMARYRGLAEQAMNIRLAGGAWLPNVADTARADVQQYDLFLRPTWPMLLRTWKETGDPRHAFLGLRFAPEDELMLDFAADLGAIKAAAARVGRDVQLPSRVMGDFGAVALEGGQAAENPKDKGAVFLWYGRGEGHNQSDALNIEIISRGVRVLPDKGRLHDATAYHNAVVVDGKDQNTRGSSVQGWLNHFAPVAGMGFADISSRPDNYGEVNRYRRAVAYVDIADGHQYAFDVFQVDGGSEHLYSLHGMPCESFTCTPALGAPREDAKRRYAKGRYKNPRQAAQPIDGVVTADWRYTTGKKGESSQVHMQTRTWGAEGGELCSAEVTGDIPFDIPCVQMQRKGANLFSTFVTLHSPYEETARVLAAERLKVSGEQGDCAAALAVTSKGNRRDVLAFNGGDRARETQIAQLSRKPIDVAGELTFDGVFGMVARAANGGWTKAMLVGGTQLTAQGLKLTADRAFSSARIAGVDYPGGVIRLASPLQTGVDLVGQVVVIGTPERSRAYEIASRSPDGRELRVKGSLLIYQSRVASVDAAKGRVLMQYPLCQREADPAFYDGRVLTNEACNAFWRIKAVHPGPGKNVSVAEARELELEAVSASPAGPAGPPALTPNVFADADGNGKPLAFIWDVAPGDEVRLTAYVAVERQADGTVKVTANVPCTLNEGQ